MSLLHAIQRDLIEAERHLSFALADAWRYEMPDGPDSKELILIRRALREAARAYRLRHELGAGLVTDDTGPDRPAA